MVDTIRSWAEIQALLADNISGAISPQDLRDTVVSLSPGHGSIYIGTPVETVIDTINVWKKSAGATLTGNLRNFSNGATGRLTYIGGPPVRVLVSGSFSVTAASNNKIFEFAIAKNGVVLTPSIQARKISTGADVGSSSLHADTDMVSGDYLEFFVRNVSDATNITLTRGYCHACAAMKFD